MRGAGCGVRGAASGARPPLRAYGSPASEAGPGNISLDFADTDIREVAAQILGSILKVNYTIDPAIHGTATLHTIRPLNRSELVPTLESLLAQNGAALITNGGLYRVVPVAGDALTSTAWALAAAAQPTTRPAPRKNTGRGLRNRSPRRSHPRRRHTRSGSPCRGPACG